MSKAIRNWLTGLFSLLLLGGCFSIGQDFTYPNGEALVLGEVLSTQYRAQFGEPMQVHTENTEDGNFEVAYYLHADSNMRSKGARAMILEFRNGVLNSYLQFSSCHEERTTACLERLPEMARGTKKKQHALEILGEPTGKSRCPTQLKNFSERCESGAEIWVWSTIGGHPTFGSAFDGPEAAVDSIFLTFDENGYVTSVETSHKEIDNERF